MIAILLPFLVIAILVLINGLFVAAEFSIIGVRPTRIEQLVKDGNRAAIWVQTILKDRTATDRYIATAQLGITLASLGLGMYAEPAIAHLIEEPLHDWFGLEGAIVHTISFIVALTIVTYLHVVFGEMVPKSLALQSSERTVLGLAIPMRFSGKLFSVPVRILNSIGLLTLKVLHIAPPAEDGRIYSPDELELLVTESYAEGLLAEHERALVANILDLTVERVGQVMRPRTRMIAIPATVSEQTMLQRTTRSPYSRLPVYEDSIDNITGMVHVKDLIRQQIDGRPFDLSALLREVLYVPESLTVKDLLAQFRQENIQMAIIIDEHGGTLGLVTLEDLLEEVVGEVWDEFDDAGDALLTQVGPGHYQVSGSAQIEDIQETLPLEDLEYDIHTINGLVWSELGRLPEPGDKISFGEVTLRVEAVEGLAVSTVSILIAGEPSDLPESAR